MNRNNESDFMQSRRAMVEFQIARRGISDSRILDAMLEVPRHLFVPPEITDSAYDDSPLPIGFGQTISQPYIVALMTELINPKPDNIILEIGTGSGYQTAVLSRLVKKVYSIERIPELAESAQNTLDRLGYDNIEIFTGDGCLGLPEYAPFDAIIVTAAPSDIPDAYREQIKEEGHIVIPVGDYFQKLWRISRTAGGFIKEPSIAVRFVPLIGGKN